MEDLGLIPGLGRSLRGGHDNPHLVFLPGELPGQRSLVGYSPWGHKELDTTEGLTEQQLSNKNQIYISDNSHQAVPSNFGRKII